MIVDYRLLPKHCLKLALFSLRCCQFALLLLAGLLVMLVFFNIGHQTGFFTLFCETLERLLERFVVTDFYSWHEVLDTSFPRVVYFQ